MSVEEQEKIALLEAKCQALQLRLETALETLAFTRELKQQSDNLELISRKGNEELIDKVKELEKRVSGKHQWAESLRDANARLQSEIKDLQQSKANKLYKASQVENTELKRRLKEIQNFLAPKERKSK